jgi:hypothetical protein
MFDKALVLEILKRPHETARTILRRLTWRQRQLHFIPKLQPGNEYREAPASPLRRTVILRPHI